jgi:hydrogenase nickel incorporation protein HypA/HybF
MHELAIAESVVSAVLEHTGGRQVSEVRLRVGQLSGVVPDALLFCFDLAAAGTPLEGASVEIEEVEAHAHCRTCGVDFAMIDSFLLCDCGSADVELLAGRELALASVEVS